MGKYLFKVNHEDRKISKKNYQKKKKKNFCKLLLYTFVNKKMT